MSGKSKDTVSTLGLNPVNNLVSVLYLVRTLNCANLDFESNGDKQLRGEKSDVSGKSKNTVSTLGLNPVNIHVSVLYIVRTLNCAN